MGAGYLQVAWMMFGTYELARGKPIPRRMSFWLIGALLFVGTSSTLISLASGAHPLNRASFGIRWLVLGVASIAASHIVRRLPTAVAGIGRGLVSGALFLYGTEYLVYLILGLWGAEASSLLYLTYLGLAGFILQSAMGLGMIVWLLEEERDRVVRVSEQIEHLAYHDPLTELPNRQLFILRLKEAMEGALSTRRGVAVLFLDLDRFKVINDSLGHTCGDQLLCKVAERLRNAVRETDTVSRLGGDEFTLLLTGIRHEDDVLAVAKQLMEALRQPFNIQNQEFYVTASMGISVFPDDGTDAETLLKNSDTAMYRAKEHGRDNYKFYTPTMNSCALELLALENGLRRGLVNNEFVVFYQPIVSLVTGEIETVEALLRWEHPELGLLLPVDFLPVAETLGMMDALSQFVLREACGQVRTWQKHGLPHLGVAVNLSARPFQDSGLIERIKEVLDQTGLRAEYLELEITENVAMQDADVSLHVLTELNRLGVRIAIDDFGTGYSSLSYLRSFPIDTLKIDRSFVCDLTEDADAAAIASAVIALAHSLKINVVAEGVETEAQRYVLKRQHCDLMQGHLFSRAVSAADCELLLFSTYARYHRFDSTVISSWDTHARAVTIASD
jgi:diguanylate cyclase (GGDEF)-like protein